MFPGLGTRDWRGFGYAETTWRFTSGNHATLSRAFELEMQGLRPILPLLSCQEPEPRMARLQLLEAANGADAALLK